MFLAVALVLKALFPLKGFSLAASIPFASPGRNVIQRVTVDLTSAQLLALLGTPIQIVPAPGSGLRIVPLLAMIHMIGGGVAYTDAGGAVSLAAGSANYPFTTNNIFLVTVSPNKRTMTMSFGEILDTAANPPTPDNAALNIQKITNNLAAGTGTARVTVYFFVEPST
jgi:hypothetical protein